MNIAIWTAFLGLVEEAVTNPQNKAAVKIVRDGLTMWKDISTVPSVVQFEADIAAYEKLRAAAAVPAPAPAAESLPVREVQNGMRGGPNGGRMSFDQ